jgi:hypothetical protein
LEQHSEDPIPELTLELIGELAWMPPTGPVGAPVTASDPAVAHDPIEEFQPAPEVSTHWESPVPDWLEDTGVEIVRATRSWIQYGTVGFAVICIIIGAVEALFGR